jgi:hypothetical protein
MNIDMSTEIIDPETLEKRILKLKELIELVIDVDIMYHGERKDYFFEWKNSEGNFVTLWLGDLIL